jgi:calmodulin
MPLSESEIAEAKEAFTLFDVDSLGQIKTEKIATALRSLGYIPTANVLREMEKDADKNKSGYVKLGDFLRQVEKAVSESRTGDTAEQFNGLLQGLEYFFQAKGKENDLVTVKDLKHVLSKSGEKISEEELDELFRELVQTKDGKIKFSDFVAILTNLYVLFCYPTKQSYNLST